MPDLSYFVPKGMSLQRTLSGAGTNTISFGIESGGYIFSHAQQSDGKIILGGNFASYNNKYIGGCVTRIDPTSGEVDTAFSTNIGGGAASISTGGRDVYSVVVQPDGKILVSGLFDEFNSVTQQGLVRLNSDGTADTAFNANVASLFNRSGGDTYAYSIALQSDGKIILGGFWNNGLYDSSSNPYNIYYLARLNSNGTIDTTFSSNGTTYPAGTVYKVVVQSDDKILVGGAFTTFITSSGSVSVSGLARLNANGTLDTTFNTALGTGIDTNAVRALAVQSDGSIIFGGDFTSFNGTTCDIARVSSTGTFDTSFNTNVGTGTPVSSYIFTISVQGDGKILVGGYFSSWNGTTVGRIVRLNSDGTRDTAFTTANGTGANSTASIRVLSQLSSGDILVAGESFSSWNGTSVDKITTLSSAGARNTTFLPKPEIVFAILAGAGGGVPDIASDAVCSGGGAGAVVMGLVPLQTSVVIGAGGRGTGGQSRYSTLIADGGAAGVSDAVGSAGSNGSGGSGGSRLYTSNNGTRAGGNGSVLFTSLGGAGGACAAPSTGDSTADSGSSGTSGGGGGAASYGVTSGTGTVTGGNGGSGLVGGGGGGAGTARGATAGTVLGGAGGSGIYSGGARVSVAGTNAYRYSSGGGGGGLLGAGATGSSASGANSNRSAGGSAGGLGGGGAGGGVGDYQSDQGANGGNGCVLLYW